MGVRLETAIKRLFAESESDELPRVGVVFDGALVTVNDLPPGSTVLYGDSGRIRRWSGSEWVWPDPDNETNELLREVILELRSLREHVQLVTS